MSAHPSTTGSFHQVLHGLDAGNQEAARLIYQRYVDQLIHLAAQRLDHALGAKADPESVTQSVFLSFFQGQRAGEYSLHNWAMVYGLLAHITIRKCLNRNRDLRRAKRDASREVTFEDWQQAARGPAPEDEAMVAELLRRALAAFDDDQRRAVELFLDGRTAQQVAATVGLSTRTIERILERFRKLLFSLLETE